MTPNAAIYARQSIDIAEGIDRQLARCRALAAARGWQVAEEYVDNDTSASKDRGAGTAWGRMLAELRPGHVVIAVDLDRLIRRMEDLTVITATGASVLTVDGEVDLTTADGAFRAQMLTALASFEVRRKGERQRRANEHRTAQGRPVPGRRRYGYETDGVTPRPDEAAIVRRVFTHVAEGGTLRSMARALTAEGVSPAPGRSWSARRLGELARNEHYSGRVTHLGVTVQSDVVVPIVPEEQAAEVRAILTDPSRRTSTAGPKPRHLLSGLLKCGICGGNIYHMRGYLCRLDPAHVHIAKHIIEPFVLTHLGDALLAIGPGGVSAPASSGVATLVERHGRNADAVAATLADRDEGLVTPQGARRRLIELREVRESIEADLERLRGERSAAGALGAPQGH